MYKNNLLRCVLLVLFCFLDYTILPAQFLPFFFFFAPISLVVYYSFWGRTNQCALISSTNVRENQIH